MLVGKTRLDFQNKDLISVTKDFSNMLLKSRRISEKEKTKADQYLTVMTPKNNFRNVPPPAKANP